MIACWYKTYIRRFGEETKKKKKVTGNHRPTTVSSTINSRGKSRFLPFYNSYSRPLRENTALLVAAYCRNSRTGEM